MKEHPILFSTPMVQAILEGRKTQTRRIVKPQPKLHDENNWPWKITDKNGPEPYDCPYGQPGDVLWVRETFSIYLDAYLFKSTNTIFKGVKWKPSIHMPKDVAQIWLQITEVKVELVQNISNEDVIAEGVKADIATDHPRGVHYTAFSDLWIKINGNGSWISNPWVWVVKFKILSTTGKSATSNQQLV
jgi:hypothetical protein